MFCKCVKPSERYMSSLWLQTEVRRQYRFKVRLLGDGTRKIRELNTSQKRSKEHLKAEEDRSHEEAHIRTKKGNVEEKFKVCVCFLSFLMTLFLFVQLTRGYQFSYLVSFSRRLFKKHTREYTFFVREIRLSLACIRHFFPQRGCNRVRLPLKTLRCTYKPIHHMVVQTSILYRYCIMELRTLNGYIYILCVAFFFIFYPHSFTISSISSSYN